MRKKGFKLIIKAPKVRKPSGLLTNAGRTFRSGKVYIRKTGKRVEQ
jgi:hypothetical protein